MSTLDDELGLGLDRVAGVDGVGHRARHEHVAGQRHEGVPVHQVRLAVPGLEGAVLVAPGDRRGDVEPVGVVEAAGHVGESGDAEAALVEQAGEGAADHARALDVHAQALTLQPEVGEREAQDDEESLGHRLPRAHAPREGQGLACDGRGRGGALVAADGVEDPGHHALVRVDVRGEDVALGADVADQVGRVATHRALELAHAEVARVGADPAAGAAEGHAEQRALPGHPAGEGAQLVELEVGLDPGGADEGAQPGVVLDPEAVEHLHVPVVHPDGDGDLHLAVRLAQHAVLVLGQADGEGSLVEAAHHRVERRLVVQQRGAGHGAPARLAGLGHANTPRRR